MPHALFSNTPSSHTERGTKNANTLAVSANDVRIDVGKEYSKIPSLLRRSDANPSRVAPLLSV